MSDSCYAIENGYVKYTLAVNNPNKEYAPQSVNVSVVGRTSDGKISFSDDWCTSTCLPESTTYWTNQAGNGNVSESDTIEIKLSVDDDKWFKTSQKYDFYAIGNVSTAEGEFGDTIATGEITLKNEVELKGFSKADAPMLVCVLKDANGKLVGGFSTYITKQLKVGEATPFEIRSMSRNKVDFCATATLETRDASPLPQERLQSYSTLVGLTLRISSVPRTPPCSCTCRGVIAASHLLIGNECSIDHAVGEDALLLVLRCN